MKRAKKAKPSVLGTRFGRRRGWEIQHFRIEGVPFWRITGTDWCRPASREEIQMWRLLKKAVPGDFGVWR